MHHPADPPSSATREPDPAAKPPAPFALPFLVGANLLPLIGVLGFGWDAGAIIILYWAENVVVGCFNVLKMALVRVVHPLVHLAKLYTIPFFIVHFGGFCGGHGFFVLLLTGTLGEEGAARMFGELEASPAVFLQLLRGVVVWLWRQRPEGLAWPVAGLVASHAVSFVQHFLRGAERESLSLNQLMYQPYARIGLLHVIILFGAAPTLHLGSPMPMVAALVLVKTGADIALFIRTHRRKTDPTG